MLTRIQIKNFALIKEADCIIQPGFTVITGETGAGKSLLIQAISLALGKHWKSHWLHQSKDSCHITLHFNLSDSPDAKAWLCAHNLSRADEHTCLIHRKVSSNHRSQHSINGQDCSLKHVRELGTFLVNLHGQHQQQKLLDPEQPLLRLDTFAKVLEKRKAVHDLYQAWHCLKKEIQDLTQLSGQQEDQQALLNYQLEELHALNLEPNEWDTLNQTHRRLSQSDELMQGCLHIMSMLDGESDYALLDTLHDCQHKIDKTSALLPELGSVSELLKQAYIYVKEAHAELESHVNNFESDPECLQVTEQRLNRIYELARKHKVQPQALEDHYKTMQIKLSEFTSNKEKIKQLNENIEQVHLNYQTASAELTQMRQHALPQFNQKITEHMRTLGMPHGVFEAHWIAYQNNEPRAYGNEQLTFYATTNLGVSLEPLNKIASGGELSRMSLIIEAVTQQEKNLPTLLFDEVDVGVSGAIAEKIGILLRQLGQTAQIVCITHLAQVAAQGTHHLSVEKISAEIETYVTIQSLEPKARVNALAQLMGGVAVTPELKELLLS